MLRSNDKEFLHLSVTDLIIFAKGMNEKKVVSIFGVKTYKF